VRGEAYLFGEFTLQVSERRLLKSSDAVPLPPKTHDVLATLVRRAGELITKRELLDSVWPDLYVEEGILAVHISALRKTLGPDAIETVPRSGYRFARPVTKANGNGHSARPYRPDVYELFGRGRSHLLGASMFTVPQAIECFRAAIAMEPTYAAAHAGLALACCAQAEFRLAAPAAAYQEAKTASLAALALDSSSADAQVALGTVLFLSEWNWTGAERALSRALELNPNHTEGYLIYGRLLEALGELDRGLEMKQKALERDPMSPMVHLQVSLSYWNQHRFDDAIEWAGKALALDPRNLLAREHLAGAYWKKGDFEKHMAVALEHAETAGVSEELIARIRAIYNKEGRPGIVRFSLSQIPPQAPAHLQRVILNAELGQLDEAFESLGHAIESRDPCLVHLAVAPQWDALRGDSRFVSCLARMGLPLRSSAAGSSEHHV
jgi:DNA-binding winged helix-turn-helix (wHTH) protein